MNLAHHLPILGWIKGYSRELLTDDFIAALIVTVMLIPQSLAYAMLAGLPPVVGLYASIGPLLVYTLFGTSRTLSVGPVAVLSLLTAAAVGKLAAAGSADYAAIAIMLALLSGGMLVVWGILRLGFFANLLSRPVIAGFITASGILIALSQMKHILGIESHGQTLFDITGSLIEDLGNLSFITLTLSIVVLAVLLYSRSSLKRALQSRGLSERTANMLSKIAPAFAVVASTLVVALLGLDERGVNVVGKIPAGLPHISIPTFTGIPWEKLIPAAFLISLIGYVESVSVGQTLAAKRRQRIDPDQELVGLGTANIASAFSGGFPVTGGFSRSVVNYDAGARTPMAGAFTALAIALSTLYLTPLFEFLPIATLAATIIIAVLSLINISEFQRTWKYSKSDFTAMILTLVVTLGIGVEMGLITGVLVSLLLHIWRTSRPHIAVVGRVPGTEHFRNVHRHDVETTKDILSIRIDESLYFANARFLEDRVYALVAENNAIKNVILACPAINEIDASALETLETINQNLQESGITLNLSEVKGPVMDKLKRSHFLETLSGQVYLTHHNAVVNLAEKND